MAKLVLGARYWPGALYENEKTMSEVEFLRRQQERVDALQVERRRAYNEKEQLQSKLEGGEPLLYREYIANETEKTTTTTTTTIQQQQLQEHEEVVVIDEAEWFHQQLNKWKSKVQTLLQQQQHDSSSNKSNNNNANSQGGDEVVVRPSNKVESTTTTTNAGQEQEQQQCKQQDKQQHGREGRRIRQEICHLQLELYTLRTQFLSSSILLRSRADQHNNNNNRRLHDQQKQSSKSENEFNSSISVTTSFYNEFLSCQTMLDETKERILTSNNTKGKFTFRRYHEAILQRQIQQQQQQQEGYERITAEGGEKQTKIPNMVEEFTSSLATTTPSTTTLDRLEGYRNVTIQIFRNVLFISALVGQEGGHMRIHKQRETCQQLEDCSLAIDRPPVILSKLEGCRVEYHANDWKREESHGNIKVKEEVETDDSTTLLTLSNVHVVNSCDLVVDFGGVCGGDYHDGDGHQTTRVTTTEGETKKLTTTLQALYVTNCTNCTFQHAITQQVRLHESQSLICDCHITAGAILEGCHDIVFYNDTVDHCDKVRDFFWLKSNIPSPNFCIRDRPQIMSCHGSNSSSSSHYYHKNKDSSTKTKGDDELNSVVATKDNISAMMMMMVPMSGKDDLTHPLSTTTGQPTETNKPLETCNVVTEVDSDEEL